MFDWMVDWMYQRILQKHKEVTGVLLDAQAGAWNVQQCYQCLKMSVFGSVYCRYCGAAMTAPAHTSLEAIQRTTDTLRKLEVSDMPTRHVPAVSRSYVPVTHHNELSSVRPVKLVLDKPGQVWRRYRNERS